MKANDLPLLAEARAACLTGKGKATRLAAGLSQGEIARAIGVTPATLSRWEAERRHPTGEAAVRYAQVLRALVKERGA